MLLNHQYKTEVRDPRSLRVHELRRQDPEIDKEMPDWIAMTESVGATGIMQPLLVTKENLLVDGVRRWVAAKDWQFKEVPVVVVPDELAGVLLADSLIARKQMTRGAAVYCVMRNLKKVVEASEYRRLANLKAGRKTNEIELNPQHFAVSSNLTGGSDAMREGVKGLCIRWGISRETFYKARLVWLWLNEPECGELKQLHKDLDLTVPGTAELKQLQESLRLDLEHQLLTGEKNLWNVESGIKGSLTGGAHEPPVKQLELFGDALDSLAVRSERFQSPEKAAPEVRKWIAALERQHEDPDKVAAKLQQVAETCEVTKNVIREHLKKQAKTA